MFTHWKIHEKHQTYYVCTICYYIRSVCIRFVFKSADSIWKYSFCEGRLKWGEIDYYTIPDYFIDTCHIRIQRNKWSAQHGIHSEWIDKYGIVSIWNSGFYICLQARSLNHPPLYANYASCKAGWYNKHFSGLCAIVFQLSCKRVLPTSSVIVNCIRREKKHNSYTSAVYKLYWPLLPPASSTCWKLIFMHYICCWLSILQLIYSFFLVYLSISFLFLSVCALFHLSNVNAANKANTTCWFHFHFNRIIN